MYGSRLVALTARYPLPPRPAPCLFGGRQGCAAAEVDLVAALAGRRVGRLVGGAQVDARVLVPRSPAAQAGRRVDVPRLAPLAALSARGRPAQHAGGGGPALRQRAVRARSGAGSEEGAEPARSPPSHALPSPSPVVASDEAADEVQAGASRDEGVASRGGESNSAEAAKASTSVSSTSWPISSKRRVASPAAPLSPAATAEGPASARLLLKASRSLGGKLGPSRRPGRVKLCEALRGKPWAALRGGGEAARLSTAGKGG